MKLQDLPPHDARTRLKDMDKQHKDRRELVWVELGDAPLACAMEGLGALAELTSAPLTAGATDDLAEKYCSSGWRADDAVLQALACVTDPGDFDAVKAAICSVYLPWVEDSARYLQKMVDENGYPEGLVSTGKKPGECILFVDHQVRP